MTEKQLRQKVVDTAVSYLGANEVDGSFKAIIDLYNSHKPLARGYAVKYTDAWCSTFASAISIACGLTDIFPTECGCEKHTLLFKKLNSWVEDDGYTPSPGDVIFYNWDDNGKGDCTGGADHVGIVVSVSGGKVKVIEGNKNEKVDYRTLSVNGKYIRGYGVPKYASKATETEPETVTPSPAAAEWKVGDIVNFTGSKHYTNANGISSKTCKAGRAKVTQIYPTGKHPYHLVRVLGAGSTVYGWVDAQYIAPASSVISVGSKVKVNKGAKTYTGGGLASFVYAKTFDVLELKDDRAVIGLGGKVTAAMNVKDLTLV